MFETLMKFGNHRVDIFDNPDPMNKQMVAFYVRGDLSGTDIYSRDAKHQLYLGLAILSEKIGLQNLAGVYVDVNDLNNIERPAYVRMKQDLENGLFRRIFVLSSDALMGDPLANADLCALYRSVNGFEIISCESGDCKTLELPADCAPLAV